MWNYKIYIKKIKLEWIANQYNKLIIFVQWVSIMVSYTYFLMESSAAILYNVWYKLGSVLIKSN